MISSVKEEDELRDVVIIMSQQLPYADLFIKLSCLFPFSEAVAPPIALDLSYVSFYRFLCLMQKHLREVTPFSDRNGLWRRRVSGLFFLQTDGEKEGG